MEPPSMTQDEFFRHLNLQSVHSANSMKFQHYRQAIKERLRPTTKQNGLNVSRPPLKTPPKHPVVVHNRIPWLSPPKKTKLLTGLSNVQAIKRSPSKASPEQSSSSILKPLYENFCPLQHPGVRKEVQNGAKCRFDFPKVSDSCQRRVLICEKKTYLPTTPIPSNNSISHSVRIRIQDANRSMLEKDKASIPPMPPAIFNGVSPIKDAIGSLTPPRPSGEDAGEKTKKATEKRVSKFPRIRLFGSAKTLVLAAHSPINNSSQKTDRIRKLRGSPKLSDNFARILAEKCENLTPVNSKLSDAGEPPVIPCQLCERKFTSRTGLQYHVQHRHFKHKRDRCFKSEPSFDNPHVLLKRLQLSCDDNVLACKLCGKTFGHQRTFDLHASTHSRLNGNIGDDVLMDTFHCKKCDALFTDRSAFDKHQEASHSVPVSGATKKETQCDICYKAFTTRSNMIKHLKNVHASQMHRVDLSKLVSLRRSSPIPT